MNTARNLPIEFVATEERRKSPRLPLQIPLFIRSRDARGEQILELVKSLDISANGSLLVCPRTFEPDDIVSLTIPAPHLGSSGQIPNASAPFSGRITRQEMVGDVYLIAVEFLRPLA